MGKAPLEFLRLLLQQGICFFAGLQGFGLIEVTPEEAIEISNDPEGLLKVFARSVHFPVARLKDFLSFENEERRQCRAMTRKGRRCLNHVCPESARNWIPGISDRCWIHREVSPE